MRILVRGAGALTFVMLVASCSGLLKKKDEDAGADAAVVTEVAPEAAAPVPAPAALATNEDDIARFPDETKIEKTDTLKRSYNVREAPPAGAIVAALTKGTSVTQIATRPPHFLVVFDNPKAPGTKLMGWVHKDAFSAVVQDAGPLVCPTGEIALFGDTPFCGKLCSADKDCPTTQACKGQANKLLPTGKAGDGVTVCTAFHPHDGGAPAPAPKVDAGAAPDAGKAAAPDAGKTEPSPAADVVAATNGTCPGNFVLVKKTGKCHRPCTTAAAGTECKNSPHFCIRCDGDKKVCATDKDQCK
jgi:hypothetical protein